MSGRAGALRAVCSAVAAVALLLVIGCRSSAPRSERGRMLGLAGGDPVEIAIAQSPPGTGLVVVYWPKVGECQACAAGVAEAVAELTARSSTTRVVEVWPESLPMPEVLHVARAEVVRLGSSEYSRQAAILAPPRIEAWSSGRLLWLQTLDARRASADFVTAALDHCLGVL